MEGGGCLFDEFHGEQVRQSFRSDGLVRSWVEGGGGGWGKSATMLYHLVGISHSSSRILWSLRDAIFASDTCTVLSHTDCTLFNQKPLPAGASACCSGAHYQPHKARGPSRGTAPWPFVKHHCIHCTSPGVTHHDDPCCLAFFLVRKGTRDQGGWDVDDTENGFNLV